MADFPNLDVEQERRKRIRRGCSETIAIMFILAAGCYFLLFYRPPDWRVHPCVGRDNLGQRYATLTPPPERVIVQPNDQGGTTLLAATKDGQVICRWTQWGNTLEDTEVTWSPDRSRIVWDYTDRQQEQGEPPSQLFAMKADGTDIVQITSGILPPFSSQPVWSPNGNRIAFLNGDEWGLENWVYVVNADGTGRKRSEQMPVGLMSTPAWSPDGTKIAVLMASQLPQDTASIQILDENLQIHELTSDPNVHYQDFRFSTDIST